MRRSSVRFALAGLVLASACVSPLEIEGPELEPTARSMFWALAPDPTGECVSSNLPEPEVFAIPVADGVARFPPVALRLSDPWCFEVHTFPCQLSDFGLTPNHRFKPAPGDDVAVPDFVYASGLSNKTLGSWTTRKTPAQPKLPAEVRGLKTPGLNDCDRFESVALDILEATEPGQEFGRGSMVLALDTESVLVARPYDPKGFQVSSAAEMAPEAPAIDGPDKVGAFQREDGEVFLFDVPGTTVGMWRGRLGEPLTGTPVGEWALFGGNEVAADGARTGPIEIYAFLPTLGLYRFDGNDWSREDREDYMIPFIPDLVPLFAVAWIAPRHAIAVVTTTTQRLLLESTEAGTAVRASATMTDGDAYTTVARAADGSIVLGLYDGSVATGPSLDQLRPLLPPITLLSDSVTALAGFADGFVVGHDSGSVFYYSNRKEKFCPVEINGYGTPIRKLVALSNDRLIVISRSENEAEDRVEHLVRSPPERRCERP